MTQTLADAPLRLTTLASCAGCAAKLPQTLLCQALAGLPATADPRVLVCQNTADDAGIYRLDARTALVQTIDFFTPIVDDPYLFGQIAAANAISDVFAMGGRPLTALNVVGLPADKLPMAALQQILRGGADMARQARVALLGGHTIRLPEPVYGMAVTGLVDPKRLLTNAAARAGDLLVLTKPVGTGIATTGLKRQIASPKLLAKAVAAMTCLNTVGHALARHGLLCAATDVTGFGVLGHLHSMAQASGVAAELQARDLPVLDEELYDLIARDAVPGGSRTNLAAAEEYTQWHNVELADRILLTDAQTSGGLLLAVSPRRWPQVRRMLRRHQVLAMATIGRIVKGPPGRIVVTG